MCSCFWVLGVQGNAEDGMGRSRARLAASIRIVRKTLAWLAGFKYDEVSAATASNTLSLLFQPQRGTSAVQSIPV